MKRQPSSKRGDAMFRFTVRASGSGYSHAACSTCGVSEPSLRRLARRLGVEESAVHQALHAMKMSRAEAITRVNRVTVGLQRELGGSAILRRWAHTPIRALDNRKPVDLLAEGRVEPLERLEAVLKSGVYS